MWSKGVASGTAPRSFRKLASGRVLPSRLTRRVSSTLCVTTGRVWRPEPPCPQARVEWKKLPKKTAMEEAILTLRNMGLLSCKSIARAKRVDRRATQRQSDCDNGKFRKEQRANVQFWGRGFRLHRSSMRRFLARV